MLMMILVGVLAVCGVMLLLWLIHLPLHNAAIVDAGWAGGLALLGVLYAIMGTGWATRRVMIAAMALVWGLRLSLYLLFTRVIGQPEEGRYVQLRREWRSDERPSGREQRHQQSDDNVFHLPVWEAQHEPPTPSVFRISSLRHQRVMPE